MFTSCLVVYLMFTSRLPHVYLMFTSVYQGRRPHIYLMFTSCLPHVYLMFTSCLPHVYLCLPLTLPQGRQKAICTTKAKRDLYHESFTLGPHSYFIGPPQLLTLKFGYV